MYYMPLPIPVPPEIEGMDWGDFAESRFYLTLEQNMMIRRYEDDRAAVRRLCGVEE